MHSLLAALWVTHSFVCRTVLTCACASMSFCHPVCCSFRYSSKAIMSAKLLYAISNCSSIDGDATHEGRANMAMSWEDDDE